MLLNLLGDGGVMGFSGDGSYSETHKAIAAQLSFLQSDDLMLALQPL